MLKNPNSSLRLTQILTLTYLGVVIWIILFKLGVNFTYMDTRLVNWIPFPEVWETGVRLDRSQVILNILIFLPWGLYLPLLFPNNSLGKNLLYCFLLSFSLESLQWILRIGALDTTDLITNTSGGLLGWAIVKLLEKWTGNPLQAQRIINNIASIGTVLMVALLLLLKLDLLPIRYR